jgi:hypothetical protein
MAIVATSSTLKPSLREIMCSPFDFEILHAGLFRGAALGAAETLLDYLGSKTETDAVPCATEAHSTYSPLNGSLSRRKDCTNIEAGDAAHCSQDSFCQLIDDCGHIETLPVRFRPLSGKWLESAQIDLEARQ